MLRIEWGYAPPRDDYPLPSFLPSENGHVNILPPPLSEVRNRSQPPPKYESLRIEGGYAPPRDDYPLPSFLPSENGHVNILSPPLSEVRNSSQPPPEYESLRIEEGRTAKRRLSVAIFSAIRE
ncbi:MAG: hypothetical protein LBR92_04100 [Puniceicoccales bacterium]|nr:hypothetical protein [Puniceicoccales bacterium]